VLRLRLGLTAAILCVSVLFVQACSRPLPPQEACSFVQNPDMQRVSWNSRLPVKFYLHKSVPIEAYAAIDRAIREFNKTVGGGRELLKVMARGSDGDLLPRRDGYSTIYWFTTWDRNRASEQARTTIYWSGVEIFEADIRINADDFTYNYSTSTNFPEVDLDSLMVHEFGHALGLAHSSNSGSVMNPMLADGEVRRTLGSGDLSNLKCEY